ncbi:hypothetical protein H8356DRAFT_1319230 [Neocallimastix lanati (nom. inval.)]|nr:hypothetical protein H8356DRAFT_1755088 [Neocallimastix sp. JGI-2020a]KAG4082780.1 hypothetical protein H8356DRAFT_1319230 [Neocallimastix sp. JGI-2020a]
MKKIKTLIINSSFNVYDTVNQIAKENNLSKTAIFLVIYSIVLSFYSGQDKIYFDIVSSNRMNAPENLIGMFVKYIPVLVKMENSDLISLIKKYMGIIHNIFSFELSLSKVSKDLNLLECNSHFKFDPYEMLNNDDIHFVKTITQDDIYKILGREDLLIKKEYEIASSVDLYFVVTEKKDYYEICFTYNSDLYDDNMILNIVNNFFNILSCKEYFDIEINYYSIKNILKCNIFNDTSNIDILHNTKNEPENETNITNISKTELFNKNNTMVPSLNISSNNSEVNRNIKKKKIFTKNNINQLIKKIIKKIKLPFKKLTKKNSTKNIN